MWVLAFKGFVGLIGFLSGLSGWFHDRAQQNFGAQKQVLADQHAAIQAMRATLNTPQVKTQDELEQKLKDGQV